MTAMRVFLGLKEVAGYYQSLKEGFLELGVPCTFINLVPHRFNYEGQDNPIFQRWVTQTSQQSGKLSKRLHAASRWLLMLWSLIRHDVFIFASNTSFLPNYADLPILKRFGKVLIFQYHGSDGRPAYLNGSLMNAQSNRSIETCLKLTRQLKHRIETIEKYADVIVNNPVHGQLHERSMVTWLQVGIAKRPSIYPQTIRFSHEPGSEIKILHSPSNPIAKGSSEIRQMVRNLQKKGLRIQLIEIVDQPNKAVLNALEECDFVIDQCYADYAMPGFAAEAAWYGKPTIIGGYAGAFWDNILPSELTPPSHYCLPEEMEAAIERMATDHDYRKIMGQRARVFVESQWHPRQVAQRYLDLAKGQIPQEWYFDPKILTYWQGCCLSEAHARILIRQVYTCEGVSGFSISHDSKLLSILEEIACAPAASYTTKSSFSKSTGY